MQGITICVSARKFSGSANSAFGGVKKDKVSISGHEQI
jgi:hypothetical protein